ncbi:MAG TPA: C2 family cysteine protease [Myxococcota bacterium]|nr:C2 family cysteine protease [Myxococcota bacterium]
MSPAAEAAFEAGELTDEAVEAIVVTAVEGYVAGMLANGDGPAAGSPDERLAPSDTLLPEPGVASDPDAPLDLGPLDWLGPNIEPPAVGEDGNAHDSRPGPNVEPPAVGEDGNAYDPRVGPVDDDVTQGTTNDCWILATLNAVANANPQVIKDGIQQNADGTFGITLFDPSGRPEVFQVSSPGPGSAYPLGGTLADTPIGADGVPHDWVALYEQAFLQYAEKYPDSITTTDGLLEDGYPNQAYHAITGQSASWVDIEDAGPQGLWETLSGANSGVPVVTNTVESGNGRELLANGLVGYHIYAVMGTNQDAQGNRTVTLRNPWADRAPRVAGAQNQGDGVITLPYDTYLQYFIGATTAHRPL